MLLLAASAKSGADTPPPKAVEWHAEYVASGMYLCRLTTDKFSAVIKMLVMK